MQPGKISLNPELFANAFPFHIEFGARLEVLSVGRSLKKLVGPSASLALLSDLVQIRRPFLAKLSYQTILQHRTQLFILTARTNAGPLLLRGEMVPLREDGAIVFLGSPWLSDASQLKDLGLGLNDFALHDATADLIHVIRTKDTAIQETAELAAKLRQTNEALREQHRVSARAEAETRAVVTTAVDAIITINQDGTINHFNPAAERVFGFTASEAIGRNVSMLMPSPHSDQHNDYIHNYIETGMARVIGTGREVVGKRKDGTTFPCELSVSEMVLEDRHQFVGIVRDITERRLAELLNQATTSRFEALITNLQAGVLVENEQRRVVLANQVFCDIFEIPLPPSQMVGLDGRVSADEYKELFTNPDEFVRRVDVLLDWKRPVMGDLLTTKSGRMLTRDYTPIFVGDDYRGHLWYYRDITADWERERELIASEQRKSSILRTALDAIITVSVEGMIVEWNPAATEMFGWSEGEAIGRNMAQLIMPEEHRDAHKEGMHRLQATGEARIIGQRMTLTALKRDGSVFPCEFTVTDIPSGDETYYTAFMRDISDRVQAVDSLRRSKEIAERANQAKTEFLSVMSHEIRTPLNAILGMSEILADTTLDSAQKDLMRSIVSGADSLLALINDFLDISKIEAGQLDLEPRPFRPRELVDDVARILRGRAEIRGLSLHATVSDEVPHTVVGDVTRIRQILLNLVGNAVKFTEQGRITLHLEAVGLLHDTAELVFVVRDTGLGIPERAREQIFERFFQADQSTARRAGGTGLGLGICKALTDKMAGRIWIEWTEEGVGSEFRLLLVLPIAAALPSSPAIVEPATRRTGTSSGPTPAPPMRVLLAEDNLDNRRITEMMLASGGHLVDSVVNGEALVRRYEPWRYDIILTDIEMPECDGITATERIRRREREEARSPVPIVALSAHALLDVKKRALDAGMSEFLTKPATRASLLTAIERFRDPRPVLLVVDDSPESQDVVVRFLSDLTDLRVATASNGREALTQLARCSFAAMILDMEMPVLDGFDTARQVRQIHGPQLPIIALSGHDDPANIRRCLEAGCDRYLVKPVRRASLLQSVRELVRMESVAIQLDPIEIEADEDMKDLMVDYLENRRTEVATLRRLLDAEDFAEVRRIGHNLKGSAGSYGFDDLGPIGASLEAFANDADADEIARSIEELERVLERIVLC